MPLPRYEPRMHKARFGMLTTRSQMQFSMKSYRFPYYGQGIRVYYLEKHIYIFVGEGYSPMILKGLICPPPLIYRPLLNYPVPEKRKVSGYVLSKGTECLNPFLVPITIRKHRKRTIKKFNFFLHYLILLLIKRKQKNLISILKSITQERSFRCNAF